MARVKRIQTCSVKRRNNGTYTITLTGLTEADRLALVNALDENRYNFHNCFSAERDITPIVEALHNRLGKEEW